MVGAEASQPIESSLLASLPRFLEPEIQELLATHFGILGTLSRVSGERDLNYKVESHEGRCYILKISGDSDGPEEIAFQNAALTHLQQTNASLPVPRVIAARDGRTIIDVERGGRRFLLRLLSYLDGDTLLGEAVSSERRLQVGELAALLDLALADFSHPGADRTLIWDIAHAGRLGDKIAFVQAREKRALAERVLRRFDDYVAPRLASLRRQIIHNDLNQNNVLVHRADGQISGIIDFGDMVNTILVAEPAVAAAHLLYGEPQVLSVLCDVVRGYAFRAPLFHEDLEVLPTLVEARLASREIIVSWRRAANPNAATSYRDDVSAYGWEALARCDRLSRGETLERIFTAAEVIDQPER